MGSNSRERHQAKRRAARRAGHGGSFGAPPPLDPREIAIALVDQATLAMCEQDPAEFAHCRDLLVQGPGGVAGLRTVDRALLTALQARIEQAWQRGWQPAELVRMARRERTARHGQMIVDGTAAQMRDYPAATVDQRWQVQLAAIDARVWWERDDEFLTAWAEQQRVDRSAAVTALIESLVVLVRLPEMTPVVAMPGAAGRAGSAAAPSAALDQRMLDRVRALLAKAESTDFPQEAEAFTAKAQELMTRHRIDHALLAVGQGDREHPMTRRVAVDNPYEMPKSLLLQEVAEANGCRAVWLRWCGLVSVVGFAADLDATELLFTSLLVQATRAMTGAGSRADRSGRNTTRSFRQSFLTAYAARIGERLTGAAEDEVARAAATPAAGASLLPVLAARTEAVQDAVAEQFPQLKQVSATASNREGWASGRAAADRAVLHGRESLGPRT